MKLKLSESFILILIFIITLVSCGPEETPTPTETPDKFPPAKATATATLELVIEMPYMDEWGGSDHADRSSKAFVYWDDEEPAEVPEQCAKCHTTTGYQDFLGVDDSEPGLVDDPVAVGEVIMCVACHNAISSEKTSVVMPSGIEVKDLGGESRCIECHQGLESKSSVDSSIEELDIKDDEISGELEFLSVHYFPAAVTSFGTDAKGGYEYNGNPYLGYFGHVKGFQTCIDCHDPHSLELIYDECADCHLNVNSIDDLRKIRMEYTFSDFDGDGNVKEGIAGEIDGVQRALYQQIRLYSSEIIGEPIAYDSQVPPYFFMDENADGKVKDDEALPNNGYAFWTPRLLKAAYNYHLSQMDAGAYVHGGKYVIQLLYDSIEDLQSAQSEQIAINGQED